MARTISEIGSRFPETFENQPGLGPEALRRDVIPVTNYGYGHTFKTSQSQWLCLALHVEVLCVTPSTFNMHRGPLGVVPCSAGLQLTALRTGGKMRGEANQAPEN